MTTLRPVQGMEIDFMVFRTRFGAILLSAAAQQTAGLRQSGAREGDAKQD